MKSASMEPGKILYITTTTIGPGATGCKVIDHLVELFILQPIYAQPHAVEVLLSILCLQSGQTFGDVGTDLTLGCRFWLGNVALFAGPGGLGVLQTAKPSAGLLLHVNGMQATGPARAEASQCPC